MPSESSSSYPMIAVSGVLVTHRREKIRFRIVGGERGAVQLRSVDRDRGPARKVLRDREVRLVEYAIGPRPDERERAERPAPRPDRDDDHRVDPDRAEHGQIFRVGRGLGEHLVRHDREKQRFSGADHRRNATPRIGLACKSDITDFVRPSRFLRIDVRHREALDLAIDEHVDPTPVDFRS